MTVNRWLRIIVPILGLLVLSQLVTGLSADRIPYETYEIVHVGGGILLVILVAVHVMLNWNWVKGYARRARTPDTHA